MSSIISITRLGAPPVERTAQSPQSGHQGTGHVGAGAGHHPAGEGGHVETVIESDHQVLLHRPDGLGAGRPAGAHPQVVGRMGGSRIRGNRLETAPAPVVAGQDGGDHRRKPHGVVTALGRRPVQKRAAAFHCAHRQQPHTQHRHGVVHPGAGRIHHPGGFCGEFSHRPGIDPGDGGRKFPIELECPHVLEAAGPGQMHSVVLAVVKKPLVAANISQLGVGHRQSLETRWGDLHS